MDRYQKSIAVLILMLVFATIFLHNTKSDFSLIFKKDLLMHDESSNSVVAANITRKFFPPVVRVNPLKDEQGNWMEGPFWQHIPPLFAYVPYLFFKLDGQVTIEVKRLSYAFVTLLTGLLFIWSVYRLRKSLWAAAAATVAAIFWVNTPFTHELITGYAFGVSDIVLAFTIVCSFSEILWYLEKEKEVRLNYPYWRYVLIGAVIALPIMTKNLLGAIPAVTFFGLLFWDKKKKNTFFTLASFLGVLALYYGALYLSSPQTFQKEIIVPIFHVASGYEGWGRAWHYYLTNYLPQRYLFDWAWIFYAGLVAGGIILFKTKHERKDKVLLLLSGGWFAWNLVAVSLVTTKVPNFIYQSYLLSLFFIVYSLSIPISNAVRDRFDKALEERFLGRTGLGMVISLVFIASILITSYETIRFARQFKVQRAAAYDYQSEHEKFYQAAEEMRSLGLNTGDLVIVRVSDNDCWFRYYPLFLTGTETKTLLEMSFGFDSNVIKRKFSRMYFFTNEIEVFDLAAMTADQIKSAINNFLVEHQVDIQADILRIKKDKSSCQWLVPDPILNAP